MKTLIAFLALVTACAASQVPPPRTVRTVDYVIDATVALVNDEGRPFCTGSFVDRDLVVTAAHCVDDEDQVLVAFREDLDERHGRRFRNAFRFDVLSVNTNQDVALLASRSDSLPDHETLSVAVNAPRAGEPVLAVGHPLGLTFTVTTGVVSSPSRYDCADIVCEILGGERQHWTQVSSPVFFGNSGGPVVNRRGQLVGVTSFLVATPHLAGVVHVDEIRRLLERPTRSRLTPRR